MNGDKDVDIPFVCFYYYENISSCYLHKHLLPELGKTCPLCVKLEKIGKGKVTTQKNIVLKSGSILDLCPEYFKPAIENCIFIYHTFKSLEGGICAGKWYDMFVSQHNKFD